MLDQTAFEGALKQLYPDWFIENLVYKNNPALALINKMENFVGSHLKFPTIFGNPQNRSADFATAQAGTSSSKLVGFLLQRTRDYSLATIDNETLEASQSNEGAFLQALKLEMDGALHSLTRSRAKQIFGGGTGLRGVIGNVGGGVITLVETSDIVNFEVGMSIEASATNGGTSVRSGAGLITAVDRINGTITYSGTITSVQNGDYIFAKGDYDKALSGFDAWLPLDDRATRLGTSFFGVTRTVDQTRLGGWALDYSAKPIEEALIDASALLGREGSIPDYVLMNNLDRANLVKALGSKVQYIQIVKDIQEGDRVMAKVGFSGLVIEGDKGPITVVADQNCPKGRAFMLQMDTWELCSLGKLVRIFDTDGLKMLRSTSSDGVDLRCVSYAQLACRAPGYNAQIKIA